MSHQNNDDDTLLSAAIANNAAYYRTMTNEEILLRHKEAESLWLKLIFTEPHPDYAEAHQNTIFFWQTNMDTLVSIMKERNLDIKSESKDTHAGGH